MHQGEGGCGVNRSDNNPPVPTVADLVGGAATIAAILFIVIYLF
jgi:hypothetical protein